MSDPHRDRAHGCTEQDDLMHPFVARYEAEQAGSGHIVMQDPEGNEFCLD